MKANLDGEKQIMSAVAAGVFRVDELGRVWRGNQRAENRTPQGYLQLRLMRNGKRAHSGAHRIVFRVKIGDIPVGLTINHKNGLKDDNRPENLELATYSQQAIHSIYTLGNNQRYLDQIGEKNHASKLTNDQAEAIRVEYAESTQVTQAMLAAKYGVNFRTISKIVRGERRCMQSGPTSDYRERRWSRIQRDEKGRFVS